MIEPIGLWVAQQLGAYALRKQLDKVWPKDGTYVDRLAKVINDTNNQYVQKFGVDDREGKFGFYKSQIIIDELLRYRIFKNNDDINENHIINALSENPNIVLPTQTEIKDYLDIFNEELKKDGTLKKLAIEEGYKAEIFAISQQFAGFINQLGSIERKLDRTLENTEQLLREKGSNDPSGFEKYIDKMPEEVRHKSQTLSAFSYRSGQFDYVNRKEDVELKAFCDDDKPFSWWAVTGPGGSGKSRLVYQFILQNQKRDNWTMKFFQWDESVLEFKEWDYSSNLLLVIDYLPANSEKIGQWLNKLRQNRANKLRILLIERAGIVDLKTKERVFPQWYQSLLNGGGTAMSNCLYKRDLLELNMPSRDMLAQIADNYIQSKGKQVAQEVIESVILHHLTKIDPGFERPLYVLFLADAWLDHGVKINHWDMSELQEWVNLNELKKLSLCFTHHHVVDDAALEAGKYLTAFATAVSELNLAEARKDIPEIESQLEAIRLYGKKTGTNYQALKRLCGTSDTNGFVLKGIVPDIMGEYFCLNFLKELDREDFDGDLLLRFTENAWKYDTNSYLRFLARLSDDFSFDLFVEEKMFRQPQNQDESIQYGYGILLMYVAANQPVDKAVVTMGKLETLSAQFRDHEEIQLVYANGLVNLTADQTAEDASITIDKLERLSDRFEGNEEIQVEYAKGLVNLTVDLTAEDAALTVGRLERLSGRFEGNEEIQVLYAKGLFNLSNKQQPEDAALTVGRLERLSGRFEGNGEIQVAYAKSLFNLSNKQQPEEAALTVGRLESLSGRFEGNGEIQLEYAKGLFNLSNKQQPEEAALTVGRLESLSGRFAGNGEIQVKYAKGLFNLSNKQQPEEAALTVGRLESLSGRFAGNGEIQVWYAKSLFNLSVDQTAEEAALIVGRLESLSGRFEGNGAIHVVYAQGLVNLSNEQQPKEAALTVERLERLSGRFEGNVEIQVEYAKGLFNLSNKQQPEEAALTVGRLESLSGRFEGNGAIQVLYAQGLVNLSNKQQPEDAALTVGRLERLSSRFEGNVEIQVVYAKGLFNLSNKQQPEDAALTVGRLERLSERFKGNGEIQLEYAKGLFNLSNKQQPEDAALTVGRLESLSGRFEANGAIQVEYAKGLFNLSVDQTVEEVVLTVERLESLTGRFEGNEVIQVAYAKGLVNLFYKERDVYGAYTRERLEKLTQFTHNKKVAAIYGLFLKLQSDSNDEKRIEEIYVDLVEFVGNNPTHGDTADVKEMLAYFSEIDEGAEEE